MNPVRIGQKLRELRGAKTAAAVAEDIGVCVSSIFMYERGERIPRDEIKKRISDYYGVPLQDIFFFD